MDANALPHQTDKKSNFKLNLILIFGISIALILRFFLLNYTTMDFFIFLNPWIEFIQQQGGYSALNYTFTNYTPAYTYLLIISWYLFKNFSSIFVIKIISIFFDFLLAFFVTLLANPKSRQVKTIVFITVLIYPTVFINSALWGQADVIYTTCLIAALYFHLKKQNWIAFAFWGLAFAFKAQAIFLLPFFIIMWIYGKVSWKHIIAIPTVYIIMILPAWIAGRSFSELLMVYFNQAGTYSSLTMNAPNLYQWLPFAQYESFLIPSLICAAILLFILIFWVAKSKFKLTDELVIELALLSCLITPFILPKMHDRYFYPADILSLVLFFFQPKRFYIPLLVEIGSILAYAPFLLLNEIIPLQIVTILPFSAIILILINLRKQGLETIMVSKLK